MFDKKIPPSCSYCVHGRIIDDADVLCRKHGPVPFFYKCRSYCYDPLQRTPALPVKLKHGFTKEDFDLEAN